MATEISLKDLGVVVERELLARRDEVVRAVRVTVKLHAPRLAQEEIASSKPYAPVDRGVYKRSFHAEDIDDGCAFYNDAPYAGVLELGRRPGKMPPVAILAEWVIRKGLVGKRKAGKAGASQLAAARGIAFAIAAAMKKRGWPTAPRLPFGIIGRTVKRLGPLVAEAVKRAAAGEAVA